MIELGPRIKVKPLGAVRGRSAFCAGGWSVMCDQHGEVKPHIGMANGGRAVGLLTALGAARRHCEQHSA